LTVSQDHLLAFIDQHLARRREREHRVAYRFVSSDDCAALDVERAVASIRDEAAKPHGKAPVYVNSSIADAVMGGIARCRSATVGHPSPDRQAARGSGGPARPTACGAR
jgi:hypothetical protein